MFFIHESDALAAAAVKTQKTGLYHTAVQSVCYSQPCTQVTGWIVVLDPHKEAYR